MPGKTVGIALSKGWPGTQSRTADAIIQCRVAANDFAFGIAAVLNKDNQWEAVTDSTTDTDIAGVTVREVVQANTYDPQSNSDYLTGRMCDVMVRGNMVVKCQRGTPAPGQAVYVRVKANSTYADAVVGGFEATDDSTNTVQVTNIEWTTGEMDANNVTEITIKSRAKG